MLKSSSLRAPPPAPLSPSEIKPCLALCTSLPPPLCPSRIVNGIVSYTVTSTFVDCYDRKEAENISSEAITYSVS